MIESLTRLVGGALVPSSSVPPSPDVSPSIPSTVPYASSSGFRFVFDGEGGRDAVDTSAVAQELGVFIRSALEQPLTVSRGPAELAGDHRGTSGPGSGGAGSDRGAATSPPPPGTGSATPSPPPGSGSAPAGTGSATSLLTLPARVAAGEKAEQACRALDSGWWAEAAELFVAGTALTPTDAFLWFGAGLAASRIDASRAADHLEKASRYLLPADPPGSTYVALLAAAHREAIDDRGGARRLLQRHASELAVPCPTLNLHLARLGSESGARVSEALALDPLLEADVRALGLDLDLTRLVETRVDRGQRELALIELSVAELREVEGSHPLPDDIDPVISEELPLVAQEVALWQQVAQCQQELTRAGAVVEEQTAARQAKEKQVATLYEVARTDLNHLAVVPFFVTAVAIAVAIVATFIGGRLVASRVPVGSGAIMIVVWLAELCLVGLAVHQFIRAWWPHRSYPRARRALVVLPQMEWQASELRQAEFDVHRRFNRVSQDAELRIRRAIDRRSFLIPQRPMFDQSSGPQRPEHE